MSILELKNIRKSFDNKVVLDGIDLTVDQGEVVSILGPSGSGKSTLLNIMAGLEKPTKGSVWIAGKNGTQFSEKQWALFRQRNIGFVFQSYNLMPTQTAIENVAMPLMFKGVNKRTRTKEAIHMLKAVGLASRMMHRPTQMSGGQQQRVGIARAFVAKPKIVFADEPTGNLDSKTSRGVMEIMVRMAKRYHETLIIVTHDVNIAKYADRIINLHDGSIVSDEPNQSIVTLENEQKEPASAAVNE